MGLCAAAFGASPCTQPCAYQPAALVIQPMPDGRLAVSGVIDPADLQAAARRSMRTLNVGAWWLTMLELDSDLNRAAREFFDWAGSLQAKRILAARGVPVVWDTSNPFVATTQPAAPLPVCPPCAACEACPPCPACPPPACPACPTCPACEDCDPAITPRWPEVTISFSPLVKEYGEGPTAIRVTFGAGVTEEQSQIVIRRMRQAMEAIVP